MCTSLGKEKSNLHNPSQGAGAHDIPGEMRLELRSYSVNCHSMEKNYGIGVRWNVLSMELIFFFFSKWSKCIY